MAQITGREFVAQPVFNGFLPDNNVPLVVGVDYDFTAVASIESDMTLGDMNQSLPFIQTAFVDNSANANQLSIYLPVTNVTIKIPAHVQAVVPIYSAMPFKPRVSTTIAAIKVRIEWCNFQQPIGQWAAT